MSISILKTVSVGEEEGDQNLNMLVCRVSLLKNGKETVSVGEEEEDQNLNMLVCRVSLLKNGKETVSVGEEVEDQNLNTGNYAGSSIILQLEKVWTKF